VQLEERHQRKQTKKCELDAQTAARDGKWCRPFARPIAYVQAAKLKVAIAERAAVNLDGCVAHDSPEQGDEKPAENGLDNIPPPKV
jgi:hypothetical protein